MGMRHHIAGRQFGRSGSQRRALLKSLMTGVILHDRIRTNEAKAKEVQPLVEKLITLGRVDSPHARSLALSTLGSPAAVERLFTEVSPRFTTRNGGYTRIFKIGVRPGDRLVVCQLLMVE